jgi:hypothetical protein
MSSIRPLIAVLFGRHVSALSLPFLTLINYVGSSCRRAKGLARPGRSGHFMNVWGHAFNWAALAIVWLSTVAIGIAIHFLPVARLLDGKGRPTLMPTSLAKGRSPFAEAVLPRLR